MGNPGTERRGWRSAGHWLAGGGLAFILWAWIDSGWYTSDLSYYHDTRSVALTQYHGEWLLTMTETPSNRSWPGGYMDSSRSRSSPREEDSWRLGRLYFPLPVTPMKVDRLLNPQAPLLGNLRQSSIGIAHWFIAVVYLVVWWVLRRWQRRRQARLA